MWVCPPWGIRACRRAFGTFCEGGCSPREGNGWQCVLCLLVLDYYLPANMQLSKNIDRVHFPSNIYMWCACVWRKQVTTKMISVPLFIFHLIYVLCVYMFVFLYMYMHVCLNHNYIYMFTCNYKNDRGFLSICICVCFCVQECVY